MFLNGSADCKYRTASRVSCASLTLFATRDDLFFPRREINWLRFDYSGNYQQVHKKDGPRWPVFSFLCVCADGWSSQRHPVCVRAPFEAEILSISRHSKSNYLRDGPISFFVVPAVGFFCKFFFSPFISLEKVWAGRRGEAKGRRHLAKSSAARLAYANREELQLDWESPEIFSNEANPICCCCFLPPSVWGFHIVGSCQHTEKRRIRAKAIGGGDVGRLCALPSMHQ